MYLNSIKKTHYLVQYQYINLEEFILMKTVLNK